MRKHNGVTLIGFIFFAVCICILGLLVLRIAPVYIKHYYVVHAAQSLRSLPKADLNREPIVVAQFLRTKLISQLYVNEIRHIKPKEIKIKRTRKSFDIEIKYEVRQPLVYNITLLFDFDTKVEVPVVN
jgi:hypothetical protein